MQQNWKTNNLIFNPLSFLPPLKFGIFKIPLESWPGAHVCYLLHVSSQERPHTHQHKRQGRLKHKKPNPEISTRAQRKWEGKERGEGKKKLDLIVCLSLLPLPFLFFSGLWVEFCMNDSSHSQQERWWMTRIETGSNTVVIWGGFVWLGFLVLVYA